MASNLKNFMDENAFIVSDLADVNTVVGKPITTASGFQIIPFSKVTIGNLSGGGEYGEIKTFKDGRLFSGGQGGVVSMKPLGFLLDDGQTCRILRVSDEPLDNLIEHASEWVQSMSAKGKKV